MRRLAHMLAVEVQITRDIHSQAETFLAVGAHAQADVTALGGGGAGGGRGRVGPPLLRRRRVGARTCVQVEVAKMINERFETSRANDTQALIHISG